MKTRIQEILKFDSIGHSYLCEFMDIPINQSRPKIEYIKDYIGNHLKYNNVDNDCILNFASAKKAGGGVLNGAVAQEEDICRNTLLYKELIKFDYSKFIGIDNYYSDFFIYSKNIPTITDNYDVINNNCYITSAAPNFNGYNNFDHKRYRTVMYNRIKNVMAIAVNNGHRNLTLGAWGCGVFRNDPNLVANFISEAIDIYGGNFDKITFVIPDDYNMKIFMDTI